MDIVQADFWIGFVAKFFTIAASGVAIYVFWVNKEKIATTINLMLNYSNQITLTELKLKIERLNDFIASDKEHKREIIYILSEIHGQMIGNKKIKYELAEEIQQIGTFLKKPWTLSEQNKRGLVSKLKECIKNVDISTYKDILGDK